MAKFCSKCGSPIPEGINFCSKCGATIGQDQAAPFAQQQQQPPQQPMNQQPAQTQPYQQQYQQTTPPPQQPNYGQTQQYAPSQERSTGKIIAIILVVIILGAVFAGVMLLFVFNGSGSSDSDSDSGSGSGNIVGTWKITQYYMESDGQTQDLSDSLNDATMIFNSDGTGSMDMGYGSTNFNWEIQNGKICGWEFGGSTDCSDISISGNTLTISATSTSSYGETSYTYSYTMVMNKQ